ncbi:hypothetical protein Hanom_Chr00s000001g01592041 [Helianthus anomalus]
MMQAVDEPLAFVAKWALAKTRAGSIPSFGSSCIAFTELDISEREYNPALIPTSAQPPTPSATPITCSSTHIKCASSPPVASLSGCGRYEDPDSSFRVLPCTPFLSFKLQNNM